MLKNKPTVVIGASPNADRYSNKATLSLQKHGHTVYPIGIRSGKINDLDIITNKHQIENIDTVTLYVGLDNQPAWIDYIISLNPKRIIYLRLRGNREIPLTRAGQPISIQELENQAAELAKLLQVSLEGM